MKKIILIVLVSLSIHYTKAQTGNRDSIIQLLQKDKEDTSRVLHLADLSFEYLESKPDTTLVLALQALALANRIGFEKGKAVSLNRIGTVLSSMGNHPQALENLLGALRINEKIKNNHFSFVFFRIEWLHFTCIVTTWVVPFDPLSNFLVGT